MEPWYKIVKPALRKADVSHEAVAEALGLTAAAVSHKLKGRRSASLEQVKVMVTMAGLELKDLEESKGRISTSTLDIELLESLDSLPEGMAETIKRGWIQQINDMKK